MGHLAVVVLLVVLAPRGPAVTVRTAPDGCPPAPFVAELRALGLDVSAADRDEGVVPGVGVALQRHPEGVQLILWLEASSPPERLAVGSATCDTAALLAAPIVNRRLRAEAGAGEPAALSLRPLVLADRAPLAIERGALPAPPPAAPSDVPPWAGRVDVLSGVELAFDDRRPDAAGVEVRAVVFPRAGPLLVAAALGFDAAYGWPASEARITDYALEAWARGGAGLRWSWLELEPTLGLGLSHHLLRLDEGGSGFVGRTLPRFELALGLGVAHPVSVRLDLGLLWAPWTLTVLAPTRGLDASVGGLTLRARLGFGIDFL